MGVGTVALLLGFIAIGGLMFHLLENWEFLDAFYFCFITVTTIGFGDFVPSIFNYLMLPQENISNYKFIFYLTFS